MEAIHIFMWVYCVYIQFSAGILLFRITSIVIADVFVEKSVVFDFLAKVKDHKEVDSFRGSGPAESCKINAIFRVVWGKSEKVH